MNQKTKFIFLGVGGLFFVLVTIFIVSIVRYQVKPVVPDAVNFSHESTQEPEPIQEQEASVTQLQNSVPDLAAPPDTNTVPPTGKQTCTDSDPNNDVYTKGSVTTSLGGQKTVYDYCSGTGKQISEMWCYESPKGSGNYVNGNMMKDCPNGCYDGRCLKEGEIDPAISSSHLHFLSPKGGESLCMGEEYIIRWEGPKELSTVSLWVYKGMAAAWNIEDLPATFNESNTPGKGEFVWKVGVSKKGMIPEGYAYTLGISGNYPQSMRQTNDYFQTDKPFSLINCQG
jgi:hypothetical protein